MAFYIGIDIGAVSAKAAILADSANPLPPGLTPAGATPSGQGIYVSSYRRVRGRPLEAAKALLGELLELLGPQKVRAVSLTGSGGKLVAGRLKAAMVNEFKALAEGLWATGVSVRTAFEMGGEASKYLRLAPNPDGTSSIIDYSTNGDCAAGTGSFIDQQCGRLRYNVEEIGQLVLTAQRAAQVAGRCSVFAKSDMIHAQQKGYAPPEVLRGLCDAVARNFRMAVVRSHPVEAPVAFVGGLAANVAVVRAMREAFELDESRLVVPAHYAHIGAIGAAVAALRGGAGEALAHVGDLQSASDSAHGVFPTQEPLSMNNVLLLRDKAQNYQADHEHRPIDAYLGIDIGSVSTNVVAIDDEGNVIHEIYVRTLGRPIEVVSQAMAEIERLWGARLNVRGVGATGSGRELIGELVGADTINDEITAHKTGATFIGKRMLGRTPDTIFEIGGQDAKYISLQDGVVVDFTMNEACAAGTGSFLEERAEELEIPIKDVFASLALSSKAPIRLGERCTVFMERDVNSYVQRGADKADLVAGLAYSVVYNYINRVVRGRPIGECVFFQGGTAYNDAVAAAFAAVLGKQIIVPPHNGVMGAIGAALLARQKMSRRGGGELSADHGEQYVSDGAVEGGDSRFRGYDMAKVDYSLREFTCKGCSNSCAIQEFDVEGAKTYWGDKCSDRFRKRSKSPVAPVIDDLFELRQSLLMDASRLPQPPQGAKTVGIPLTMFALEWLPFWRTLMAHMGFATVLSEPTNKRTVTAGSDTAVAEPCFPIIVAHGHYAQLAQRPDVDYVLAPNVLSMETRWTHTESHLCPWHQTLPHVVRCCPAVAPHSRKLMIPLVRFRQGRQSVTRELRAYFAQFGVKPGVVDRAASAAFAAQDAFVAAVQRSGAGAMERLMSTGEPGVVLLGRPYNIHDAGVNLSVARKLREFYGVNCIPVDALATADVDVRDVNPSMFWSLGHRIVAGSKIVAQYPNLHIIYITNFKCGPDSYIKHYIRGASGKPFLTLQFDGHSNDAGMMTRCEAYLDSKGILRPWAHKRRRAPQMAQPQGR
jgi:predicted CoA-substrate-specific enzyme activase